MNRRLAERHESKIDETVNMGMQVVKEYLPDDDRLMTLSVGPQHPGSGHFRFTIKVDGEPGDKTMSIDVSIE